MNDINKQRTKTIVYSRVVGWLTPTKNFNVGMAENYVDRKTFKLNKKNNK